MAEADDPHAKEIKKARQQGYSLGYNAGKARKNKDTNYAHEAAKRKAFIERAFVAILPFAMQQNNWYTTVKNSETGEDERKNFSSLDERIDFAWIIARLSREREYDRRN